MAQSRNWDSERARRRAMPSICPRTTLHPWSLAATLLSLSACAAAEPIDTSSVDDIVALYPVVTELFCRCDPPATPGSSLERTETCLEDVYGGIVDFDAWFLCRAEHLALHEEQCPESIEWQRWDLDWVIECFEEGGCDANCRSIPLDMLPPECDSPTWNYGYPECPEAYEVGR